MKYNKLKKQSINFLEIVYFSKTATEAHIRIRKRFNGGEYMGLLNYLNYKKFIENGILDGTNKPYINLTPEGIDFYENYKKSKMQTEFNRVVAFTGTIVALIYLYNFLKEEAVLYFGFKLIFSFIMVFSAIYLMFFVIKSISESLGIRLKLRDSFSFFKKR